MTTKNITVTNNLVINNERGLYLWGTGLKQVLIAENTVKNNAIGIYLQSVYGNEFCHNNFIQNGKQTRIDVASENSWDNGFEGNFWSDYNGTDSDEDGIGDVPYIIDSNNPYVNDTNNQDNYPLMNPWKPERASPELVILSPENKPYSNTDVPLEITVNRVFYSTVYSLDGQANITLIGNTTFTGLLEGPHNITVYIIEYPTNVTTSRTVHFVVDTTPPTIMNVEELGIEVNGTDLGTQVNATITDAESGVEWVALNYTDGNGTWPTSEMTNLEGNIWSGTIPPFPHGTNVTYIIIARDTAQNRITSEDIQGYANQYEVLPEMLPWMILPLFLIATAFTLIVKKRMFRQAQ